MDENSVIPASVAADIEAYLREDVSYSYLLPYYVSPPLTRRQRLSLVFRDLKGCVADAIAMLRGSYECPYCD